MNCEWRGVKRIFLRNIPAKCDRSALSDFLHSRGLYDLKIHVPTFRNGKSRGYGFVSCADEEAAQLFFFKVHGQRVPGFSRTTPLVCEPWINTFPDPDGSHRTEPSQVIQEAAAFAEATRCANMRRAPFSTRKGVPAEFEEERDVHQIADTLEKLESTYHYYKSLQDSACMARVGDGTRMGSRFSVSGPPADMVPPTRLQPAGSPNTGPPSQRLMTDHGFRMFVL
mmetsp:Transcript_72998/g.171122  ORF Transcript_72998/g.171122 Transcript_72998/m.171122 type:complete len:225 (+) Transcript_72998:30-704(+)